MDFSWLWEFLYEHLGEILLGVEFFIISLKKKNVASSDKTAKLIAKKEKKIAKALEVSKRTMSEVEELKKGDE